jgi:hypothetical protein
MKISRCGPMALGAHCPLNLLARRCLKAVVQLRSLRAGAEQLLHAQRQLRFVHREAPQLQVADYIGACHG